jgi:hypothetical protein
MAYMRGDHYIWTSESDLHIWSANGQDACSESIWYQSHKDAAPAGVAIPQSVADEYVLMRFAEMLVEGLLPESIARTLNKWHDNFGCDSLASHRELLSSIEVTPKTDELHDASGNK